MRVFTPAAAAYGARHAVIDLGRAGDNGTTFIHRVILVSLTFGGYNLVSRVSF